MRGYAICTMPRSGSNFLCSVLSSTGVLGRPREYFDAPSMKGWVSPDYPEDAEGQLGAILQFGSTPNGVYGFKIFAYQFDQVKETRWALRLPQLCFVSLIRLDVLSQAISQVRASQTGAWWAHDRPKNEPVFDFVEINAALVNLLNGRRRWIYYLSRNGMPVLHLIYEQLVQNPQAAAEAVAKFLGIAETPVVDMAKVGAQVQRDDLTDEWRARFVSEARDLTRFD